VYKSRFSQDVVGGGAETLGAPGLTDAEVPRTDERSPSTTLSLLSISGCESAVIGFVPVRRISFRHQQPQQEYSD